MVTLFDFGKLKELFLVQEKKRLAIVEQLSVKTRWSQLPYENYFTNPEANRNYLNAWSAFGLKTVEGSQQDEKLWKNLLSEIPATDD